MVNNGLILVNNGLILVNNVPSSIFHIIMVNNGQSWKIANNHGQIMVKYIYIYYIPFSKLT